MPNAYLTIVHVAISRLISFVVMLHVFYVLIARSTVVWMRGNVPKATEDTYLTQIRRQWFGNDENYWLTIFCFHIKSRIYVNSLIKIVSISIKNCQRSKRFFSKITYSIEQFWAVGIAKSHESICKFNLFTKKLTFQVNPCSSITKPPNRINPKPSQTSLNQIQITCKKLTSFPIVFL